MLPWVDGSQAEVPDPSPTILSDCILATGSSQTGKAWITIKMMMGISRWTSQESSASEVSRGVERESTYEWYESLLPQKHRDLILVIGIPLIKITIGG